MSEPTEKNVCTLVVERLYRRSGRLDEAGQYAYCGKAGGCVVAGSEDGIKQYAMSVGGQGSGSTSPNPEIR